MNEEILIKKDRSIMYIMVVGFHHKKGCQLEFCYPIDSVIRKKSDGVTESNELFDLPKKWKHLPSMALPDGSHNYEQDYIYFHLEDETEFNFEQKKKPSDTLFGVSCYRQINASEILIKDSEVTRNTLQKSVCVLTRLPIYSSIRLKLHSITTAYFEQKDFNKTQLLINAFNSLNQSYSDIDIDLIKNHRLLSQTDNSDRSKFLIGLSLTDLVLRYQHKILVLFKLLLLEKRCLFQLKPVSNLSNTIMSLVSLIPDLNINLFKCSGYFESNDLINSELSRKKRCQNQSQTERSTIEKLNKKLLKKKTIKSTKKSTIPNSSSSPTISNSTEANNSLLKIFNFNNNNSSNLNNSKLSELDSDIYKLTHDEEHKLDPNESKLDFKKSILSNRSSSSSLNQETEQGQIGDLIKEKVSNVFKLVDWNQSSTNGANKSQIKRSESVSNKILSQQQQQQQNEHEISLTQLLEVNFGMPFNLYNEFNMLHPYLSLYYLDYFIMVNKMTTKLYCTTTLMMNMMKDNQRDADSKDRIETESEQNSNEAQNQTQFDPYKKKPEPKPIGYTIGATNVLFKQRLYDDLDAFIDETDIDLKNNEQLKKQLQLTTADLRFIDYIIKNVNASKIQADKQNNTTTPTLLSFKKTSSYNNFNYQDINTSSQISSTWEGSDDWIRLNFKWYLYTLLGSILKEEICSRIKTELENILLMLNEDLVNTSSCSSSASLENEVVDIDDYIEKVNNSPNSNLDFDNKIKANKKNKHRKTSTSNSSTSSISSTQYLYVTHNSNSYQNYQEDFNLNFINEFKKTDCFDNWFNSNKSNLEKELFKIDSSKLNELISYQNVDQHDPVYLNHKFQLLFSQLQDLEHIKLNHPFNGQISVNDVKLRLNFLFTQTESGRKLNKAFAEGSKIVNNTGKAVGDAFSHAKSTFSSLFSNWSSNNNTSNKASNSKNFTKI